MSKLPPRLTVIEHVYYQSGDGEPISADSSWWEALESEEQPYIRHIEVGEQWEKLDLGWVIGCSQLVVRNKEGTFQQNNPTEEERKGSALKVVELGVKSNHSLLANPSIVPFALIAPRKSARIQPADELWIRCKGGKAKVTVSAFPK